MALELLSKKKAKQSASPISKESPNFSLLSLLDRHIETKYNASNNRSRGVFHPSEIDGCTRALALDYIIAPMNPTAFDARTLRIFENGHSVHSRIQTWLHELAQNEEFFFKDEVKVWSPEWEIEGHTDGMLLYKTHHYLIEIKSMNTNEFQKLTKPKEEHRKQFNRYLGVLGINKGFIIIEDKNNQNWKEFIQVFDPGLWRDTTHRIDTIRSIVKQKTLPLREEGYHCKSCKFKEICLDKRLTDDEIFARSLKP